MFKVLKSEARGHANHGWLDSYHTFSFAHYYNPEWMGFKSLRVINQDRVEPGRGFGTHPHRDMEIVSYVLKGALEHKDSMGNGSVIKPGDVQRMSAGTGVLHSEYNHSDVETVEFLQIWLLPDKTALKPTYEQKHFSDEDKKNCLRLIASKEGHLGSLTINQHASIYASLLKNGYKLRHVTQTPHQWLQIIKGEVKVNDYLLQTGDGVAISDNPIIHLNALQDTELLLFELND